MKLNEDWRIRLSVLALIFIVPWVGGAFVFIGYEMLILAFGGGGDLLRSMKDISWVPDYANKSSFLMLLLVVGLICAGAACYLWHRVFFASGYVREDINFAVPDLLSASKKKWRPMALATFGLLNGWIGVEALINNSLPGILICGVAVLWSVVSLLRWENGRS